MGGHTNTSTTYLNYAAGQNISNAAILPVSSDGKINVETTTQTDVIIDVQGYYTAGSSRAAGGYIPLNSPVQTTAVNLTTCTTGTATIAGVAGVPTNAISAMINFVVNNPTTAGSYFTPYPDGDTRPNLSLNAPAGQSTALSARVAIGAAGKIDLYLGGATGTITITMQIEGYYLPAAAGSDSGQLTPAATRAYDSRTTTSIAAGASRTIPVAGHNGVPLVGSGLPKHSRKTGAGDCPGFG